jgi:hypothetical protein
VDVPTQPDSSDAATITADSAQSDVFVIRNYFLKNYRQHQ